ncbi:MAG TPA: DinB family protein [Thermoanaerobaculia bacterium]|nr:DinB family protein [Thermoanaerobaculia bacterium]
MPDLERKLRRLNEWRAAWLDQLQAMPPDKLVARPRPGKWSILEIVEHLAVSERVVFQGLPDPSLLVERPRSAEHRFRYLLVAFLLRSGIPLRMPSKALAPKGGRSLSELRSLWDESQEWLLAYVSQLDAKGLRRAVFEHPAAGPLTVGQVVHLNQIHIDRHVRQVESLQRLLA